MLQKKFIELLILIDYRQLIHDEQEILHEKRYFLTELKLPRLHDSIFGYLALHLRGEQHLSAFYRTYTCCNNAWRIL